MNTANQTALALLELWWHGAEPEDFNRNFYNAMKKVLGTPETFAQLNSRVDASIATVDELLNRSRERRVASTPVEVDRRHSGDRRSINRKKEVPK